MIMSFKWDLRRRAVAKIRGMHVDEAGFAVALSLDTM
jgi:hypothetical protein